MALLGCPRGHTVALETWCVCTLSLTRPGYSPSNPSPQNQSTMEEVTPACLSELRAQAACGFRYSASKGSPFFQTCKVMAAILRARVSLASSGFIPFSRRFS